MNAIPQRTHNYKRVQMPTAPAMERNRPLARIESLDERRAAKLAVRKKQKLQQEQRSYDQGRFYDDVEMYYNMRRQDTDNIQRYEERKEEYYRQQVASKQKSQKKPVKKQAAHKKPRGRKLTAAYEVKPQRSYYGKHVGSGYQLNADGTLVARPGIPGFDMNAAPEAASVGSRHVAVEYEAPKRKGVVSTIICIALVFAMLAGVLVKYAEVSKVTYMNAQADGRISDLQEEIEKLEVEISLSQDLNNVQQRATELGMSHPDENQIVYLPAGSLSAGDEVYEDVAAGAAEDVAAQDGGNVVVDADSGQVVGEGTGNVEDGKESILDKIGSFFGKVGDTISGWIG